MSPEPITLLTATAAGCKTTVAAVPKEIIDLKNLLEIERRQKAALEERLRQIEIQLYPERCQSITYQHQEVIEHTDNVRDDDVSVTMIQESLKMHDFENVQLVSIDSLPSVGQTQVVVCTNEDDDMVDEDSRTATPCDIDFEPELKHQIVIEEICRPDSPPINEPVKIRLLQPILEAAIKAEPKVEVKRINSPESLAKVVKEETTDTTTNGAAKKGGRSRMYITHNTSRQNLETIVEAIRHLEGDQLFGEMVEQQQPAQDAPLALTNKPNKPQRQLQIEMNPFLQFRTTQTTPVSGVPEATVNVTAPSANTTVTTTIPFPIALTAVTSAARTINSMPASTQSTVSHVQQQQQCRPGVIVVKPSS